MGQETPGFPGPSGKNDSPPEPAGDPVLRQRLRAAADSDGFLPFERYMEIALYDPERGFYDRAATRLGRSGDFYTASHVHALFGATLARHAEEIRASAGWPTPFPVVEVGPGDATLAWDIRNVLADSARAAGWEYVLVERSGSFRSRMGARLGPPGHGPVPWRLAPSLSALGPVRGLVLANELLDAFPHRRLQRTGDGWKELGVLVPAQGPLRLVRRTPGAGRVPPGMPDDAPNETTMEVSPGAESWIRELADHLTDGRAILIDYGDEEAALLSRGSGGTLEAIRGHRSVDPLVEPGTVDLSAWVNFTRIRRAASQAGLVEMFYGPLSEALIRWKIDEVRAKMESKADSVEAVKLQLAQKSFLIGFSSFKVLELAPPGPSS